MAYDPIVSSFIFMFRPSLIWPWKPIQAGFYILLICPHHCVNTSFHKKVFQACFSTISP